MALSQQRDSGCKLWYMRAVTAAQNFYATLRLEKMVSKMQACEHVKFKDAKGLSNKKKAMLGIITETANEEKKESTEKPEEEKKDAKRHRKTPNKQKQKTGERHRKGQKGGDLGQSLGAELVPLGKTVLPIVQKAKGLLGSKWNQMLKYSCQNKASKKDYEKWPGCLKRPLEAPLAEDDRF